VSPMCPVCFVNHVPGLYLAFTMGRQMDILNWPKHSHVSGEGGRLTHNRFWRGVLIGVISLVLAKPSRAESYQTAGKQIVAGIVVVSVGIGVLVTVLIVRHNSKQNKITGCVSSGAKGLSVTDEKEQRAYTLSGDVNGIKPGERMTLVGKRSRAALTFQPRQVSADLGACRP